ncbi:MAG: Biopolymer transport protein ExbD [Hyphomicrobiales bacterium]|nr:Biopolymer transport protein ExbD [Hyphomicrobiales bacterium]
MSAGLLGPEPDGEGGPVYRPLAEMNVTPFVDVMLVLLIVFMVTAPMLAAGVKLDLPRARNAAPLDAKAPASVSITADGRVFIDGAESADDALEARFAAMAAADATRAVHLRADRTAPHGRVVDVMSRMGAAGLSKIAIVAEPGRSPAPALVAPSGAP